MEEDEYITELKKSIAVNETLLDLFWIKQTIGMTQLNKIYDKVKGTKAKKLDGFNLKLDMADEGDRKIVGIMGRLKLPDLGLVNLRNVDMLNNSLGKSRSKFEVRV